MNNSEKSDLNKGGYHYTVSNEQIRKWKAVPTEQKLMWLEEANAFLREAMPEHSKRIMTRLRKGQTVV